ncbi:MAG: hypothetical protein HYS05_04275 [Acidobacteria bacterium]|nr:hypothetical protein [Acidobacteriota bacterium]
MADRFSNVEAQIDEVLHRLNDLDGRLRSVEAGLAAAAQSAAGATPSTLADHLPGRRVTPLLIASLTGRTSLVLGGGYLLRALTEAGLVPRPFGITLGLAYAMVWLALADRAGAAEKHASAAFHALAAAAIAFPLLYESLVKFGLLGAWSLAIAMTAVAALGMAVAWRRCLQAVVWIFSTAAIGTSAVLLWTGGEPAPFALHLVVLAAVTYGVVVTRSWWRALWPAALVADVAVFWVAREAVRLQDSGAAMLALATASVLLATTIGSFVIRMLARREDAIPFEITQSGAALLVACVSMGYVIRAFNLNGIPFGSALVAAGASGYGLAFGIAALTRRTFHYVAALALALVVAGGILTFRPLASASLWIALAMAGTWLGRRTASTTLAAHGGTYLVAAAVASGLVVYAGRGLIGDSLASLVDLTPIAWLTLAAAGACSAIAPVSVRTFGPNVGTIAGRRWSVGLPRAVALSLLVLCCTGVAVLWVASSATARTGRDLLWGLATIRTTILALAVVVIGGLARGGRVREAGWLIYPLLVVLGLKILFEDFRQSEPAMLFVALVVYGSALIFAPRLASK